MTIRDFLPSVSIEADEESYISVSIPVPIAIRNGLWGNSLRIFDSDHLSYVVLTVGISKWKAEGSVSIFGLELSASLGKT
jgi:hypothetical protein